MQPLLLEAVGQPWPRRSTRGGCRSYGGIDSQNPQHRFWLIRCGDHEVIAFRPWIGRPRAVFVNATAWWTLKKALGREVSHPSRVL